ncbi:MAG: heme o synthase [Acidiferrobacter sp.]
MIHTDLSHTDIGALPAPRSSSSTLLADLLVLGKVRVVSLLVFTAAVGEVLAPGLAQHWIAALAGLIGIAFAGAAGGTLNQLVEPSLDQHMRRTRHRPLVDGRIGRSGAIVYATVLMTASVVILSLGTNLLTVMLTVIGTVGYGVVYTLYLKPANSWNIVWGGLAGALPPLIGWTAITGQVAALPLSLVALIFVWTPAHFWPLALYCRDDYANACIPMLPVTHGVERTRREIVRYAGATLIVSLVPAWITGDLLYGIVALLAGGGYVSMTWRLQQLPVDAAMDRYARRVFKASISYLFLLFTALIAGHLLTLL